ncbi:MAG: putative phage abortive infection protein [Candidatus Theseobacter exili]|nr:putative phage abortive infection protein [Candidatus Theseobacter exili]
MKSLIKILAITLSIVGFFSLIAIIFIVFFDDNLFKWSYKIDPSVANNIGAFVAGIVGTLFSGAAFFLLYLNLYQSDQNSFENRLYSMLHLLNEKIKLTTGYEGFENKKKSEPIEGLEFFEKSIDYFNSFLQNYTRSDDFKKNEDKKFKTISELFAKFDINSVNKKPIDIEINYQLLREYIDAKYQQFYHFRKLQLGHYFRYLYRIVKIIDGKKDLSFKEKKKYVDIIQAQMSNAELGLVFYNCISINGYKRFFPLINKYSFLENMDKSYITYPYFLANLYDKIKFKFLDKERKPAKIILPFEKIDYSKYSGKKN